MQVLLNIWNDVQLAGMLASGVFMLVCMLRKDRTTTQELERASMRSMSWPTAD